MVRSIAGMQETWPWSRQEIPPVVESHAFPESTPCLSRVLGWRKARNHWSKNLHFVGLTDTWNSHKKMQNPMQWNHQILMSEARTVVQSSGSQTSLSIWSYLGNLKRSERSQGPARVRSSDQRARKSACFKTLPRDSVAQPAHLAHPLNEQRGFLLTALQSDDPYKAGLLRLEGIHCRTRQRDPDRRPEFFNVFPRRW